MSDDQSRLRLRHIAWIEVGMAAATTALVFAVGPPTPVYWVLLFGWAVVLILVPLLLRADRRIEEMDKGRNRSSVDG